MMLPYFDSIDHADLMKFVFSPMNKELSDVKCWQFFIFKYL